MDGYLLNGQYSSAIEKYETYYQTCLNGDDVQGLQPIIEASYKTHKQLLGGVDYGCTCKRLGLILWTI